MTPTVKDMVELLTTFAPGGLAETWDNVGLQIGDPGWPVETAWVALDPLPDVIDAACQAGVHLLITHHPLIFKPLSSIDFSEETGRIISLSVKHRLAVLSAHTNLDSTVGGLNDIAADLCGMVDLRPLVPAAGEDIVKLVVTVPDGYDSAIVTAIAGTPAGRIGPYTGCTFRSPGIGTFTPDADARPFSGKPGEASQAAEYRLEMVSPRRHVEDVVRRIQKVHPYETMAYDVYPLESPPTAAGLGRVGRLDTPQRLDDYAAALARRFDTDGARIVGEPGMMVKTAAVCTGSGGSLMEDFLRSGADVFISGDVRYHDARRIEMAGKALIDLGHFASEIIFARPLAEHMTAAAMQLGFHVTITPCQIETDPFRPLAGRQDG
ncbi:MAG: Nif3-like dinuclear metal center hexameric protein [Pseudomonadota bacterium]